MRTRNVADHWALRWKEVLTLVAMAAALSVTVAGEAPIALSKSSDHSSNRPLFSEDFEAEPLTGWSLLAEAGASGQVERELSPRGGETNSHALRLTVLNPGMRCGVFNPSQSAISVRAGGWFDLAFEARSEARENNRGYGLTVSLESEDGRKVLARTTIPEVGGDWKSYTVALRAYAAGSKARLVITMSEPGTIWMDKIALTARDTHAGQSSVMNHEDQDQ